eukprot:CAMPEP_0185782378 /NCGR_PEP_ID=MMETSP1174-20130828/108439_1 /TAXON_ID=35687 /ORGANISM="Dictyocha speculum, Strain CCMP1381" /LENGTH=56 /DNA_ID=CAMNT_0028472799 /DNA_START=44 /DNA_END=211 /DNA_ORIENTATION=+
MPVQSEAMDGFLLDNDTTPLAFRRRLELRYDDRVKKAHERLVEIDEKLRQRRGRSG